MKGEIVERQLPRRDMVVSYAQFNEDLILYTLLSDVSKGFYIDIGANHPIQHSVTKLFYDRGWRGINIEPNPALFKQITKRRRRDLNLNIGIAGGESSMRFRIYHSRDRLEGLSTFSTDIMKQHEDDLTEDNKNYEDIDVTVQPLNVVLATEASDVHIHFMKVDVEGFEFDVLQSNDWERFRPDILCIEANHIVKDWHPILKRHNYKTFIFDGLNEYLIHESAWHLTEGFAEKHSNLLNRSISHRYQEEWSADITSYKQTVAFQQATLKECDERIQLLEKTVDEMNNRKVKESAVALADSLRRSVSYRLDRK